MKTSSGSERKRLKIIYFSFVQEMRRGKGSVLVKKNGFENF